ncbi:MAG: hypothetical protein RJA25_1802 [Bacteroidota bacterium]|jgi:plasmid stabilization system protein ParE
MYQYLLEPKAQSEYEHSVEFYAERSELATLQFIDVVEKAIGQICQKPYSNKNIHKNYYEISLAKYPFALIYTIEEELKLIIIVSMYHHSRNPRHKYKAKKKK